MSEADHDDDHRDEIAVFADRMAEKQRRGEDWEHEFRVGSLARSSGLPRGANPCVVL